MTLDLPSAAANGLLDAPAAAFRLAGADLDRGPAVVIETGSGVYRLADLLPAAVAAPAHVHELRGAAVLDAIAGYTIINDLSARDWIRGKPEVGIDWVMMKAYDGFSPIGPWFTPAEHVPDPQALGIRCWVNDELRQDSNTSEMVFGVQAILEHLAGIMTLLPGDVVATGTPAGVGFGRDPQQFLHAGDAVAIEIDGLGRLETTMAPMRTEGPTT